MRHIPAATLETAQFFAHPHSQKPARFPAGQSERFHPAKPSFYPPAVTAGITHYTLQAKPCAKGASPLETPCFVGKSVRPTRLRLHPIPPKHKQAAWASLSSVLIYAACLPIWALTVSPILTVLIYYFHMKGPIRVSRSFSTRIIGSWPVPAETGRQSRCSVGYNQTLPVFSDRGAWQLLDAHIFWHCCQHNAARTSPRNAREITPTERKRWCRRQKNSTVTLRMTVESSR